jgi:hypothetical protein
MQRNGASNRCVRLTMKTLKTMVFTLSLAAVLTTPVVAGIIGHTLGLAAPPSVLGAYAVTAFTADPAGPGDLVAAVALPAGATPSGVVGFSDLLEHQTVPGGWATWSHGYAGDVYWLDGFVADTLVLTLPVETKAFYFYVQPNYFGPVGAPADFDFDITAENDAGESMAVLGETISGLGGAKGFGFSITGPGDPSLTTITIAGLATWPDGFAVGEFGINGTGGGPSVPEGGVALWLFLSVMIALAGLRRASNR